MVRESLTTFAVTLSPDPSNSANTGRLIAVRQFGDIFMHITSQRTVTIVAVLLLAAATTQAIYTALYLTMPDVSRTPLWGIEGILFVLLAAFAGSALAQARRLHLGWSAIMAAAVLNVVQVGVGLTMFGSLSDAAEANPALAPVLGAVVAFSFMVYNAAKVLLALAAIVFGLSRMATRSRASGGLIAAVGLVALVSNALSMALGRDGLGELPLAGGSGVLATLLLALCLFTLPADDR